MKQVHVNASKQYDILIESGLLSSAGEICRSRFGVCRICIITDDTVNVLYGEKVLQSFQSAGYEIEKFVVPHGEKSKSTENFLAIVNYLAQKKFTRSDLLVALGGGVVGDLCGFCGATYMRGIRFLQIPTTLLAAVDSSVGGKTAVDLQAGKNLLGAFWQPSLVLCDTDVLKTLSEKIFADGTAEIIKYGMIWDAELFEKLEWGPWNTEEIISRCVEIKRDIVNQDEFDTGLRQILNFGHTIGHAVETLSGFKISHGGAVAIGMVLITRALYRQGQVDEKSLNRLMKTLQRHHLPVECDFEAEALFEIAAGDKKRQGKRINVIAVKEIGKAEILSLDMDQLKKLIQLGRA